MIEEQAERPSSQGRSAMSTLGRLTARREFGALVVLLVLVVVFQLQSSGKFLTATQMGGLIAVAAPIATISAGVTVLMLSGEFDLSVAASYAMAPILLGLLLTRTDVGDWAAVGLSILAVALIGLLNGAITTTFGIPSLITTLGMAFAIKGLNIFITSADTILFYDPSTLFAVLGGEVFNSWLTAPILWAVGLCVILGYLTDWTAYGNWTRSVGARGGIVAREMGVPVKRVKTINFITCSSLAGFAGIATFASFGSVSSGYGADYELLAIVATVVGGASIFGVTGSIAGALIGSLIIASLRTGLILIGAPSSGYTAIIGLILIVAVILNVQIERSSDRLLAMSVKRSAKLPDRRT